MDLSFCSELGQLEDLPPVFISALIQFDAQCIGDRMGLGGGGCSGALILLRALDAQTQRLYLLTMLGLST